MPDMHHPARLLRLFSLLSAASVATILTITGFGFSFLYSAQMIQEVENDAIAIGQAIISQEREALLEPDPAGGERIAVAPERFAGLDRRMRDFLHPFNIYKIKVFSRSKTIVYSTDPSIIGKSDGNNAKLDEVLARGAVISKLAKKDEVRDLVDESRFEVEVVETYIPIRSGNAIVGSFEVYVDVTRTRAKIVKVAGYSLGVLAAVLLAVFGSLHVPMRQGTQRLKRAQDELRALANTDMLTGLFNRRFLFARIEEEYSRMKRDRSRKLSSDAPAFAMIDIDHFKKINDRHGHLAGDEILRQLTLRFRKCLRNYDVVGRYGGEEFLVMLPHTDIAAAREVADRMHQCVRAQPFTIGKLSIPVTVSIGVTYVAEGDEGMLDAIHRADKALYQAKNAGRDRVTSNPA